MRAIGYLVGSGSMSLGVEQAGFSIGELWETPGYAKNAETWRRNRPDVPVNVLPLDHASEHFAAERFRGYDMVYGNPPCGGLSAMTCSRIGSPTNNCMRQWVRMIVRARPRTILMENAYQLATERVSPLLDDLTGVLDDAGYWWWTWRFYSYQVGCPQVRQRMFLCASLAEPDPGLVDLADLPPPKRHGAYPAGTATVRDALWDLQGVPPSPEPVLTRAGALVTQHWFRDNEVEHNRWVSENFARVGQKFVRTHEIERMRERAEAGHPVAVKEYPKWKDRVEDDRPKGLSGLHCTRPCVVRWDDGPAPAVLGFFRMVHPVDRRLLTMRELARLMGYPDAWQFHKYAPHLIAQGIPVQNARWAANRLWKATEGRTR